MTSDAKTPEEYIASLPDERQQVISDIREAINHNIPDGFEECMYYGMINWVVPHSTYPPGYHVDPKLPLGLIGLASQKNHIAVYHMGLYAETGLRDWLDSEWPKYSSKKLDCGKSCIRFKKPADVPLKLIGDLASKLTPAHWIAAYEKAVKG